MPGEDESVVHVTQNAPWLPPGGRAEVVRTSTPARPMSLVRLLLRDGDKVFCIPRAHTDRVDLPTRAVLPGDPDGVMTINLLAQEILGGEAPLRHIGSVRNVVESSSLDYEWPSPVAHFGVWATDAPPAVEGTWVSLFGDGSALRDRHWYPLAR